MGVPLKLVVSKLGSRVFHVLTPDSDATYCGVSAAIDLGNEARGRVCSKCKREWLAVSGMVNYVTKEREVNG